MLALLKGKEDSKPAIPARKIAHTKNQQLTAFSTTIRGRFDPVGWASNAERAAGRFTGEAAPIPLAATITGVAGSAVQVNGTVRCLLSPEKGDQLLPGEILFTIQTNIGRTFVFPRAAAIVTDVGASLSHVVIVACELGPHAVIGCGDATARLKIGDRVEMDGSRGIVEIFT